MKERKILTVLLACVIVLSLQVSSSQASIRRDVEIFTSNGGPYPGLDLYVLISDGTGQVRFEFRNDSSLTSSMEGFYFDDGLLLDVAYIENDPDPLHMVSFGEGANPADLPAGQELVPPFEQSRLFEAVDSNPPTQPNGVNPGEYVAITFDLIDENATWEDVVDELDAQVLRIGVHVIGLPPNGEQSESGVIPEPGMLGLLVLGGLALVRRRR